MPSVSQILAVSYAAVLNGKRAENQWAESAFLRMLEKKGGVKRKDLGSQIEATLDYKRNPNGGFLASDLAPVGTSKTEVLTAAVYDIAEISYPITWSKKDEVQNPSDSQKVALVSGLIENAINSHDDLIEQYIFQTTTNGFLGLLTHCPTNGQGSDGGIDAATDVFWRPQSNTYVDDTDIEAAFTTTWNQCSKGTGSKSSPTWMASDATTQALFEGTQQALQRYESQDLKAGFTALMFKTAMYVFSQYASTTVFFGNEKNFNLVVSKGFFRERGDTQELENANGYTTKIYSALQTVTNNRSRLGCAHL